MQLCSWAPVAHIGVVTCSPRPRLLALLLGRLTEGASLSRRALSSTLPAPRLLPPTLTDIGRGARTRSSAPNAGARAPGGRGRKCTERGCDLIDASVPLDER